jgi:hypothetical protein
LLWYGFPGKNLSIFSKPADLHWNTFLDDLKPDSGNRSEKSHARRETMKIARIQDEPGGAFRLEYDDTLGHKQNARLDAMTYEEALREAKSYLGIGDEDRDSEGAQWHIE